MEFILKWVSFGGAILAIVLTILKIIELLKNKPILVITSGSWCFDYVNGNTDLTAVFDITNVGTKTTTLKKYILYLLDENKREVDFFAPRRYDIKTKLNPSDYYEEYILEKISRELTDDKYYFRIEIITSHKTHTRLIALNRCE